MAEATTHKDFGVATQTLKLRPPRNRGFFRNLLDGDSHSKPEQKKKKKKKKTSTREESPQGSGEHFLVKISQG